MYGTIAKLKGKPGALETLRRMEESRRPKGYIGSYVYKMDNDPHELWLVVLFEDKKTYMANADNSEQDKEFRMLMEVLETEPEWHDGEIVYASKPT